MKLKRLNLFFISIVIFVMLVVSNISFDEIFSLPQNFVASYEEIHLSNISKRFGFLINSKLEKQLCHTSSGDSQEDVIVFKLFGFIPIRKVVIKLAPEEDVYIGGVPIGVAITSSNPIVVDDGEVEIENGIIKTEKSEPFKEGDVIISVDDQPVKGIDDTIEKLQNKDKKDVEVKFLRKGKEIKSIVKTSKDITGKIKLGLVVKDDVSGIGTLTYVNMKSGKFGALGHAITEQESIVDVKEGKVYPCNLFGIQKGEINNPGQLRGVFLQNGGEKGVIEKNNKYGVFGVINDKSGLIDENLTTKIGGRLSVCPGKAKIVSSINGIREEYEIEIIKANYQSTADDKSIVFRVTDKRLLDLTGGIVQGMSGSPILQNGKMVGAVTHVFMSDPTKGYGVYSDWMVLNS